MFFDNSPDLESVWLQGVWSNIYNSVLSSVGTPLKATFSNIALMIERPIATYAEICCQVMVLRCVRHITCTLLVLAKPLVDPSST